MTKADSASDVWSLAESMDATIRLRGVDHEALARKEVQPARFSRQGLFERMSTRQIGLFSSVRVPVDATGKHSRVEALLALLRSSFSAKATSRVQLGDRHLVYRKPVRNIVEKWRRGRSVLGVTDLHFRGTAMEGLIDTHVLSAFNLLLRSTDTAAEQEMMTFVVATPGNVTDSHSDDPDGSNHCFCGKKLWLAWDTFEGIESGLDDVSRGCDGEHAAFNMRTFLRLKSSRWFVVSPGRTLFLPGHLTHKVLTLEPYLGLGSFYVALPCVVTTIARWIVHGPLWSLSGSKSAASLVDQIAHSAIEMVARLKGATSSERARWGFGYMRRNERAWLSMYGGDVRASLLRNPTFSELLRTVRSA